MSTKVVRVGLCGAMVMGLLAVGPLVGHAIAADGDMLPTFGTNGRFTVATSPTPVVGPIETTATSDVQTSWIQYSDPPQAVAVFQYPGLATESDTFECADACRVFGAEGKTVLIVGPVDRGISAVWNAGGPGPTTLLNAQAPEGTRFGRVTYTGYYFAEIQPDDPASPPYLAFPHPDPNVRPTTRLGPAFLPIGPVGTPEVLVDGRFVVASTAPGQVVVRFYNRDASLDVSRADNGIATIAFPGQTATADAVIHQADGGVAVLIRHAATTAGAITHALYRFDSRGQLAQTVLGPTLTWSPSVVDLPGRAIALVGTTTGSSPRNTIMRVETEQANPFSAQTLTGGPQAIDSAVADTAGRVVVVGGTTTRPRAAMTIARVLPSGVLDSAFGSSGVVNRTLPETTSRSFAITIGSDGNMTAVASQTNGLLEDRLISSAPRAYRRHVQLLELQPTAAGGTFTPITPVRAIDTRASRPSLEGRAPRSVDLSKIVPAGTSAVALNVTVVNPVASGYARVWSTDNEMPTTSMLNYLPKETVANATVSNVGPSRSIEILTQVDADAIVDVVGYWTPRFSSSDGRFVPMTPTRLLDTRNTSTKPGADTTTSIDVRARADLGLAHATAIALAVTVAEPDGPGYITAWPGGSARPPSSTLNVNNANELRSNMAIVGVGNDGTVSLYDQTATHLVVDAVGWFTDDSADISEHGLLIASPPLRVHDSRIDAPGPLQPGEPAVISSIGCCAGVGTAVMYNLTAVNTAGAGFIAAYSIADTVNVPLASSVNFDGPDQRRASLAVTETPGASSIALYSNARTDYIVDLIALVT
jgi:hypothetical protein